VLVARTQLDGDAMEAEVEKAGGSRNPLIRAGAAGAGAHLSEAKAVPLLLRLSRDSDPHVVDIAALGLKGHLTPEVRGRLREMLSDKDNGVRLASADLLKEVGGAEDVESLAHCLETSRGDISGEIASSIVDAAARIGGARTEDILERASFHENDFVRRKARALLSKQFPDARLEGKVAHPATPTDVPLPGADYPAAGPNPRVEIVTNRGSMVFELLRDEAPVHVFNFLALAKRGFYDGTTFHRVVPDFVIQGGDPRGDGNGGTTWRGTSLRGEFTPRKFVRGSLGMPRNDDPDSGGSQIFVTHRETPHLDGRYTLFGELREGFDVLDSIELGDVIRTVRILGGAGDR
jgi:cyclophilin family peptidyl-prolyl cis-trans isomerase